MMSLNIACLFDPMPINEQAMLVYSMLLALSLLTLHAGSSLEALVKPGQWMGRASGRGFVTSEHIAVDINVHVICAVGNEYIVARNPSYYVLGILA